MNRISQLESHLSPSLASSPSPSLAFFTKNQVAIVTGSGQGIGEKTAFLFAQHGARVVVTDIDKEKSNRVAEQINKEGGTAISVPGDITDPSFPQKLVDETIKTFGKIHFIINNAGFTYDGMMHKMKDDQWDIMLLVHQTAPFRLIRAAAPFMRDAAKEEMKVSGKADDRCIINISSTSGLHGNTGQINYSTAKAGVLGMSKTICKEWGMFGIRSNSVAFGLIDTRLTRPKERGETLTLNGTTIPLGIPSAPTRSGPQSGPQSGPTPKKNPDSKNPAFKAIPLGRPGLPSEAAGGILLLCSPYASFVSGHCLEVTGGMGI